MADKLLRSGIEQHEYEARLSKVRKRMSALGIELLFVSDPSNMNWLTGYDAWSFYVHQGVIVTHDSNPLWWGRYADAATAAHTVWMSDYCVHAYAESYVMTPERHPMEVLAQHISAMGHHQARIGLELDNYYFSAKADHVLRECLPSATFVDATNLVNWSRAVKSDTELAYMRNAALVTATVMDNLIARAQPGQSQHLLVAEIYRDLITGSGEIWGDYPAIVPLLGSGREASCAHLTWSDRQLARDEGFFVELSGSYRRYHAPMSRTIYFASAPQEAYTTAQALCDGLQAGMEVARPGATASDVAHACKAELKNVGVDRVGRIGYPVGLSYPPDWGERTYSIREEDQTVLEAGMVFHFMPGLWFETWGIEITDTVVVNTQGPATPLVARDRGLIVKA